MFSAWIVDQLIARAREQGANDLADRGAKALAEISGQFGQNIRDYHLTRYIRANHKRETIAEPGGKRGCLMTRRHW